MVEVNRKRGRSHSRSRSAVRKRSSVETNIRNDSSRDDRHHHSRRSRSRSASKDPPADGINREEAERIAHIARLAEERAEKRAAERKLAAEAAASGSVAASAPASTEPAPATRKLPAKIGQIGLSSAKKEGEGDTAGGKVVFRTKEQRQKDALERLEKKRLEVLLVLWMAFFWVWN